MEGTTQQAERAGWPALAMWALGTVAVALVAYPLQPFTGSFPLVLGLVALAAAGLFASLRLRSQGFLMRPVPAVALAAALFAVASLALGAALWRGYETVPASFPVLAVALGLVAAGGGRLMEPGRAVLAALAPLLGLVAVLLLGLVLRFSGLSAASPVEPITLAYLLAFGTPLWVGSAYLGARSRRSPPPPAPGP